MPLVFQQYYRIPENSALTGNVRDCRISDYLHFGFAVFKGGLQASRRQQTSTDP